MLTNWKTTSTALTAAGLALGSALVAQFDSDPETTANWPIVWATGATLANSIGLLFARDGNKTSKQSGAE
jgi:uncharacterized membrane protein YidH (DUF202 family)